MINIFAVFHFIPCEFYFESALYYQFLSLRMGSHSTQQLLTVFIFNNVTCFTPESASKHQLQNLEIAVILHF